MWWLTFVVVVVVITLVYFCWLNCQHKILIRELSLRDPVQLNLLYEQLKSTGMSYECFASYWNKLGEYIGVKCESLRLEDDLLKSPWAITTTIKVDELIDVLTDDEYCEKKHGYVTPPTLGNIVNFSYQINQESKGSGKGARKGGTRRN